MDYLNRALLDDDIVRLKKRIKSRWTQYQWENENQIDWKSVFIGAGFLLVVIGGLIWKTMNI